MRTIETTLYTYNELSKDVQAKVFATWQNSQREIWSVETCEQIDLLTMLGFTDTEIFMSGFGSQGDGACFIGNYVKTKIDLELVKSTYPGMDEYLEIATQLDNLIECFESVKIYHNDRYYHEYSVSYDFVIDENDNDNLGDVHKIDEFKNIVRKLSKMFYKEFEADYDYWQSEELFNDDYANNDLIEYYEDGRNYHKS